MFLPEGVAEHVEKAIGIGLREAAEELVPVLDERRVAPLRVTIEHDPIERECLDESIGRRHRADRHLDDDRGLRLELRAGDPADHGIGAGLQHRRIV